MASERQLSVSTHALDDSDTVWLGNLGQVDGIRYTWTYPGGSAAFNASLAVPPTFRHRGLTVGRLLRVWCGGVCVWKGTLDRPTPGGNALALSGSGNASAGEDFSAWFTANSFYCQQEVENAISRGLPWITAPSYPPIWGVTDRASKTIAETVQYTSEFSGKPWTVGIDGQLTFTDPPTVTSLMLLALSSGGGRATETYADMLVGVYQAVLAAPVFTFAAGTSGGSLAADTYFFQLTALDSQGNETTGSPEISLTAPATGKVALVWDFLSDAVSYNIYAASSSAHSFLGGVNKLVGNTISNNFTVTSLNGAVGTPPTANRTAIRGISTATNLASIAKHGRREQVVDYTSFGHSTAANVHTALLPLLDKFGFRARWGAAFTCPHGAIATLGGTSVDLAFVRPGVRFGVQVVDPDGGGEVDPTAVSFIAGETEYDADSDTLTVTPQEASLTDLSSLTVNPNPRQQPKKWPFVGRRN